MRRVMSSRGLWKGRISPCITLFQYSIHRLIELGSTQCTTLRLALYMIGVIDNQPYGIP